MKKPREIKFLEFTLQDDIIEIVDEELQKIKKKSERDEKDLIKLEKLSKIYSNMMDSFRANTKEGLLAKLSQKSTQDKSNTADE